MAYKPDGTRQTEALFIISRTIIAFNPLGSVSSSCHFPRSSPNDRVTLYSLVVRGALMRLKSECFMLCNYKVQIRRVFQIEACHMIGLPISINLKSLTS